MRQEYKKSIFIFRRDLRIQDNTGLINALESSKIVYCLFILDSNILASKSLYTSFSLPIGPEVLLKQKQKRIHLLRFLRESLLDLYAEFQMITSENEHLDKSKNNGFLFSKLILLWGDPKSLIEMMIRGDKDIEAVFVNRDYTPFSIRRDQSIENICRIHKIMFIKCSDILINEPEEILNSNDKPYKVFSQYYNKAVERSIRKKNTFDIRKYKNKLVSINSNLQIPKNVPNLTESILVGTRKKYLELVSELKYKFKKDERLNEKYSINNSSSHFSAYLKFGKCSIREVYYAIQEELGSDHPLLRQLYWRDFFMYIGFHFPFVFNSPFQVRYRRKNGIKWKNDPKKFEAWCNGITGFPIVDAGMRELNETGFMHNRARLIAASLLIKDLHIDWRYGERYFGLKLVDYDPSINNGNWQWVASTGCDAQPFFRIFNPWLQQEKFDPDCIYIRKWIPELGEVPVDIIHKWYKVNSTIDSFMNQTLIGYYPKPIVEHKKEALITRKLYDI